MFQKENNRRYEIVLALLREKSHLREIARTLNESPATILRTLADMAEENIIDFKKEGRNNVYFIKNNLMTRQYVYCAENYKLMKALREYPELSIILEEVLRKIKDGMVVLFGSYAKFSAKKDSDIDIYIETNSQPIKRILKEINRKISAKTGEFDNSSLLIKEIIKNHIILRGVERFYEKTKFFE